MASFIVRQQVPFWATCAQLVEADTAEAAMEAFDPTSRETSRIIENPVTDVKPGPLAAFDAEDRSWELEFPKEDWIEEVTNGETILGYREWLALRSEIVD